MHLAKYNKLVRNWADMEQVTEKWMCIRVMK